MQPLPEWQAIMLYNAPVARFATVDATGQPHVLPIVFVFDGQYCYTPLDGKPKRVADTQLQRVRNVTANSRVAFVVDHYNDNWQQLAWVQVRGLAQLITNGPEYETGMALLRQKYPQYATVALAGKPLIWITPEQIRGWQAVEA